MGERKAELHDFPAFLGPRVLSCQMGAVVLACRSGLQSHGRAQGAEADRLQETGLGLLHRSCAQHKTLA